MKRPLIWVVLGGMLVGTSGLAQADVMLTEPVQAYVIEQANYTGSLDGEIARLTAEYVIQVLRNGWTEIPLSLAGATVTEIKLLTKPAGSAILPRGGEYVLAVQRAGSYRIRVTCTAPLLRESNFEGIAFTIPQATFSKLVFDVPKQAVELRPQDRLYITTTPAGKGVKLTAALGPAQRIDVRWLTKAVTTVKVEPLIYGEAGVLVNFEEELAKVLALIDYRISQGEMTQAEIALPNGLNLLNVRGASIEEWITVDQDGTKVLRVKFRSPLKEMTYRLMVEGEVPQLPREGTVTLPEFTLRGVKQERGYVAVASVGNIEVAPGEAASATRIDVKEVPEELRASTSRPILLGFRYYQHPFAIAVGLSRHEDSPVLAAIAELGDLTTIMAKQGALVTRAVYLVKNNKKQFLTVTLPKQATLWSAIVDGTSVKPGKGDNERLLVPLVQSDRGEPFDSHGSLRVLSGVEARAFLVELVYFQAKPKLPALGTFNLEGVALDMPVSATNWTLYLPKEYQFFRFRGNIDTGSLAYAFVDEPRMMVAYATSSMPGALGGAERRSHFSQRAMNAATEPQEYDKLEMNREDVPASQPGVYAELEAKDGRLSDVIAKMEESGILPLKIHLPRAGRSYHVSRLMTATEPLTVRALFVGVPQVVWPVGWIGLVLMATGAVRFTIHRQLRT
ncbi:MAG: hypothetical protein HY597_06480 [Candidatus Omnitrophica bacterium]|nr:hypothetical protein [Candidatus Omnitrophota bacterium]